MSSNLPIPPPASKNASSPVSADATTKAEQYSSTMTPILHRTFSSSSSHRARSLHEFAGSSSGSAAYDLPSSTTMAELALVRSNSSRTRTKTRSHSISGELGSGRDRSTTLRSNQFAKEDREKNEIKEEEEDEVVPEIMDEQELETMKKYERFSERRKKVIVALVSFSAFMAPFSSSAFLPSIPTISRDLNTSPTILNITGVSIYILVIGAMPLLWAPYSGLYGRRPIYLTSLPIFAIGSLGVALSNSLAALVITRMIQGMGSSAVLSVGAGSIGDIYQRQRRGKAMGAFYSGILIGPAVAPAVAGVLTEYVPNDYGWRAMQWILCGLGVIASVLALVCFPETAHELPIEAVTKERRERREAEGKPPIMGWRAKSPTFVWLNPLAPLRLLMLPHILAISLNSSFVLMTTYTVLVPLTETVAPRYNIDNTAILGLFYLAQGIGNAFASFCFTGRMADHVLKQWLKKRNGVYVPEDRLRATLLGGGLVLPCAVTALGWVLDKGTGKVGLAFVVILLFMNGVGLMMVLTAANTYCVDVLQHRSSEVIAVNNFLRYTLSAAATAFVLPLIHRIGVGGANTLAAGLAWIGFGLVCLTIRYGAKMRELGEKWEGTASAGTKVVDSVEKDAKEKV